MPLGADHAVSVEEPSARAQGAEGAGSGCTAVFEPREDDAAPARAAASDALLDDGENDEALSGGERFLRDARQDELALAAVGDRHLGGQVGSVEGEGAQDARCSRGLRAEGRRREGVVVRVELRVLQASRTSAESRRTKGVRARAHLCRLGREDGTFGGSVDGADGRRARSLPERGLGRRGEGR